MGGTISVFPVATLPSGPSAPTGSRRLTDKEIIQEFQSQWYTCTSSVRARGGTCSTAKLRNTNEKSTLRTN